LGVSGVQHRNRVIELEFVEQRLDRTNVDVSRPRRQYIGPLTTDPEPFLFVRAQFFSLELPTTRMPIIVAMNLRVAFKAHRNRVRYIVSASFVSWDDVVCLHLHAAETVTDAASSVARR
jgi:hypothetical protein